MKSDPIELDIDILLDSQELFAEIRAWKRRTDSVILAHYYMSPELQVLEKDGGIADFLGDSLGLSVEASRVEAQNIIFCGVRFMAETAKILSPQKGVFLPSALAGCSLAASIRPSDVLALRDSFPGVPVVSYVNTYADIKAESDICCTSRNALRIIDSFDSDQIIFLPDKYMGQNLQIQLSLSSSKKLILWNGSCEVHEQFGQNSLHKTCAENPTADVLLHWEVPQLTVETSLKNNGGVVGSTNDILSYVSSSAASTFILASECDLGATLKTLYPSKTFITPCIKCPHMKRISLRNTLDALKAISTPQRRDFEIDLPYDIMQRARTPIERMLQFA